MATVVILLLVGVALLIAEIFLPGMIAGLIGLGCLVAGVVLAYVEQGPRTGTIVLVVVVFVLVGGFAAWVKFFPESRLARPFVSQRVVGDLNVEKPQLVNQIGVAYSHLRPSGTALINGQRVDVVTEGGLITRGTPIKVVAVEGLRVVVRALTEEELRKLDQPPTWTT